MAAFVHSLCQHLSLLDLYHEVSWPPGPADMHTKYPNAVNVCDSESGLMHTGVRFVRSTRHVYWLLADNLFVLLCALRKFLKSVILYILLV